MIAAADNQWIVERARMVGFDLCGVIRTEDLKEDLAQTGARDGHISLHEWLERGFAGEMGYLHSEKREDVARAVPEARSVIVCAINYNTAQPLSTEAAAATLASGEARGWISRYAWGDDYHDAIGQKLDDLLAALRTRFRDEFAARTYVDTGPISERTAACLAGLGWIGKNTCLINEEIGSSLFLAVIVTSLDVADEVTASRDPAPDLCGNCRLCLDACPTNAFVEPYVLDARRCISYLTIELRGNIPDHLRPGLGWQVFGCDICQDVCPWNRAAPATTLAPFQPREGFVAPELEWLLALDEEEFRSAFRRSPVKRAKWRGLIRNACIAAGNMARGIDEPQRTRIRDRLAQLVDGSDEAISEHARWALARFKK